MSRRVLIVEDDQALAVLLEDNLGRNGFVVERAARVATAIARLDSFAPDVVILDLTLPDGDGGDVCRHLAGRRDRPLVIILSARGSHVEKIHGLDLGADDYLAKPFALAELLARMRAVMRRRISVVETLLLGAVVVDFANARATRNGKDLGLTHRELEVLRYLADRASRAVSREDLLHDVWGYQKVPLTRSVDICITRLRRKIEDNPQKPRFIRTAHGDGYMLTLTADRIDETDRS